ncbi:histidine kinase [Aphanothece hegewaldii CCALA 016]|uniref:histidine kinase n=1 Tax=Aphanothece hegewaldii CCALA 016 TaxID=2107694 RepID=A0A2T1LTX7_9CHRO|nr:ATP-binding protein [Aphanothece hegewaldii]PSF34582.1 histidine kinase [Aphanothece hegewaldii CCALA 016]
MNWPNQNKWIVGGFSLTLLLMGLVSLLSYKNIIALRENANKVQSTYEIINNLSDFYASMTVAESGRRGYIATGNKPELERHLKAVQQMQTELSLLQKQFAHAPLPQQEQVTQLQLLVRQRLVLLKQSIDLYKKNPLDTLTQLSITEKSVRLREQILVILAQIKSEEKKLLQSWLYTSRSHIQSRVILSIFGTILSFVVIDAVFLILYYQWKKHQEITIIQQNIQHEKELIELKSKLFSMISHEFRTPLSVILSSAQLLENNFSKEADIKLLKNLDRIQSSAKLMNQFLTDLLILTRAESGNLEHNLEIIDIESFCLNLVEDIQLIASEKHQIKLISENFCHKIALDEKLLYSILSNVLINAIKYSPNGGEIYLILKCEATKTIFQIQDQGIGIISEDLPKIYQPFYRGQNVEKIMGTGLGLAVVKKCLECYHGTIDVESKVGLGTRFTITIPDQKSRS